MALTRLERKEALLTLYVKSKNLSDSVELLRVHANASGHTSLNKKISKILLMLKSLSDEADKFFIEVDKR